MNHRRRCRIGAARASALAAPLARARIAAGLAAGVMLCFALLTLGAPRAWAHAQLLDTTPADGATLTQAPAEAVLTFNEVVQVVPGTVRLFPTSGVPHELDAHTRDTQVLAALPSDLGSGSYVLSYRIVSADGHPVSGAITFTVAPSGGGAQDADPGSAGKAVSGTATADAAQQIAAREDGAYSPGSTVVALNTLTALSYLGLLAAAGLAVFCWGILRAPSPIAAPRLDRWYAAAALTAIGATVLLVPVSALNVVGAPLAALLTPAAWMAGILWGPVAQAGLVCCGLVPGILAVRGSRVGRDAVHGGRRTPHTRMRTGARALVRCVLPLLALASPVLVGHSMSTAPRALVVIADIAHLFAASFWVGGVIGLLLCLTAPAADAPNPTDAALRSRVQLVQRFSHWAVWVVALLAVSGVALGVSILGGLEPLFTTGYGLTLLLKASILLPLLAIAAYNRNRLLPRLAARPKNRMRWREFTRVLGYEAGLLVAVLVITGGLVNLDPHGQHAQHAAAASSASAGAPGAIEPGAQPSVPPGAQPSVPPGAQPSGPNPSAPITITAESQGLHVAGTLQPGLVGENRLRVRLRYEGNPVSDAVVTVHARLPALDLGPLTAAATLDAGSGEYVAVLRLPAAGEWQVQVNARVSTFAEPIAVIPVTVR